MPDSYTLAVYTRGVTYGCLECLTFILLPPPESEADSPDTSASVGGLAFTCHCDLTLFHFIV